MLVIGSDVVCFRLKRVYDATPNCLRHSTSGELLILKELLYAPNFYYKLIYKIVRKVCSTFKRDEAELRTPLTVYLRCTNNFYC